MLNFKTESFIVEIIIHIINMLKYFKTFMNETV